MSTFEWKAREYKSVNGWMKTVNVDILNSVVMQAEGVVVGREFTRMVNEEIGAIMALLELVSCSWDG